MSTLRELLQTAGNHFKEYQIADAELDAWYLLAYVFKISRPAYYLKEDEAAAEEDQKRYLQLVEQRAGHVPLQLLIGTQEFMGLTFEVTRDVLIPRQDTEVLAEEVLRVCKQKTVLDMCTGSGCIIVSLAKLGGIKEAVGVDISGKALKIAERNARKHGVKVTLLQSDLFESVNGVYDIIVSNPPYIPTGEIGHLMPEVRNYEPIMALDGDHDGLGFYRRIITALKDHVVRNGYVFFEIGYNQGKDVTQMLQEEGFADVGIKRDLSGLDRVVCARRR
jgi:release factor glutamine methyltransferase